MRKIALMLVSVGLLSFGGFANEPAAGNAQPAASAQDDSIKKDGAEAKAEPKKDDKKAAKKDDKKKK